MAGKTNQAKLIHKEIQKSIRKDKFIFWNKLAEHLESASSTGQTRKLFQLMKYFNRKFATTSFLLNDMQGNIITNINDCSLRWTEHFRNLLNHNQPSDPPNIPNTIVNDTLSIEPPTSVEINNAIKNLKNNTSPGHDHLPPELYKVSSQSFISSFHNLLLEIWRSETIPTDWETATLIPLLKKGSSLECSNYRGISLLPIAYKILEAIILNRIQGHLDDNTRESQAGFRKSRGCIDHIFTINQILQTRYEYRKPTIIAFLDYAAAFDSVHRQSLWKLLSAAGIPLKLVNIIAAMYKTTYCQIKSHNLISEKFEVTTGVRQGSILSPILFNLAIDHILKMSLDAFPNCGGISLTPNHNIKDLVYADDVAIIADNANDLQIMISRIASISSKLGLHLNAKKCKILSSCIDLTNTLIHVNGESVDFVHQFQYLGCQINPTGNTSFDISHRIQQARKAFHMASKFWHRKDIPIRTKVRIFQATIRSVLLYGCESWSLNSQNQHAIDVFDRYCLRKILRVKKSTSNVKISSACQSAGNATDLAKRRRWNYIGHILRMPENRLPRLSFLFQPDRNWKRPRGGVHLTMRRELFKHCEKLIMVPFRLSRTSYNSNWLSILTTIASDRAQWRQLSYGAVNGQF